MRASDLRIKVGDQVIVEFKDGECLSNCEVINVPRGPGDQYQIINRTANKVYVYVLGEFQTMAKVLSTKPLEVVPHELQTKQKIPYNCQLCRQDPCTC